MIANHRHHPVEQDKVITDVCSMCSKIVHDILLLTSRLILQQENNPLDPPTFGFLESFFFLFSFFVSPLMEFPSRLASDIKRGGVAMMGSTGEFRAEVDLGGDSGGTPQ